MECCHAGQDDSATHAASEEVVFIDAHYPALSDGNNVKVLPTNCGAVLDLLYTFRL